MSVNRLQTKMPMLAIDGPPVGLETFSRASLAGVILDIGNSAGTALEITPRHDRDLALFARVEPVKKVTEETLNRLLETGTSGIVLSSCRGRADIQELDVMLQVAEAAHGLPSGCTRILAEFGGSPEGISAPHPLTGSSTRLAGLIFNGEALAEAVGCKMPSNAAFHRVAAPVLAGRASVVLKAAAAGIPAYEVLTAGNNEAATTWALSTARDNGFASVICRSVEQALFVSRA
ncbi:aldolase [Ensifer sp.]|jgi:citrate lyase beta subunit|uniref:aldolase n=1 Tax=Ensifer sp. TaxID=1872086 RepID=UPI002E0DE3E9|nr:aldolase [Ensifer sp.]